MLPRFFAALLLAGSLAAQVTPLAAPDSAPDSAAAPAPAAIVSTPAPAYLPMSHRERWHRYLHENLLSSQFVLGVFGSALISHISRDPVEWGLGAHGYFHRVQNRFYTAGIDGVVHDSLAAALHEDTRYQPYRGDGKGLSRAAHAVKRTFLTYNDSGQRVFDFSGLAGIYSSSMLSTYWHPHPSPLGAGVRAGNFGVILQTGMNVFKEFSPDLKHAILRK